jgi:hypothetical protein
MIFGTLFGILVVPILFMIFQDLQERLRVNKERYNDDDITATENN